MNEEVYKKIRITRDDLIDWIDRPPSNHDIELCDYLVNALDNQFKYCEENEQLKGVLKSLREFINNHTILLYTKEAPRQLIGTIKLLEIIDGGLDNAPKI